MINYPDSFDIEDKRLSDLFIYAAIDLDNSVKEGKEKTDYSSVDKLSRILRGASRELRVLRPSVENSELILFLEREFYQSGEAKVTNAARKQSKEIIDLSEELAMAPGLNKNRIESLRDICTKLGKATLSYWTRKHSHYRY